jgi:hypothetical protein
MYNQNGVLVLSRKYFDSVAIVVLNKALSSETRTIELPKHLTTPLQQLQQNNIRINQNIIEIQAGNSGYNIFYK